MGINDYSPERLDSMVANVQRHLKTIEYLMHRAVMRGNAAATTSLAEEKRAQLLVLHKLCKYRDAARFRTTHRINLNEEL